jgi:hypothetical protein
MAHEIRHGLTNTGTDGGGQKLSSTSKPTTCSVLKMFEKSLNGRAYENFSGSIANGATLATYRFALCRFMMFRKVSHPDELLIGDQKLLEAASLTGFSH